MIFNLIKFYLKKVILINEKNFLSHEIEKTDIYKVVRKDNYDILSSDHKYLGEIIYDENNGKYFRFLDGREDLSAVMKYYEEKNKGQGSLGENEGESYEQ